MFASKTSSTWCATFTDGTMCAYPPVRVAVGVLARRRLARARQRAARLSAERHRSSARPRRRLHNLKAELSYKWKAKRLTADNLSEFVVGIVGNNLLNADIRNHVSYNKDEVLMPGQRQGVPNVKSDRGRQSVNPAESQRTPIL